MSKQERIRKAISGYPMLLVALLLLIGAVTSLVRLIQTENPWIVIPMVSCVLFFILTAIGFFIVNPNDARVLVLFGTYKGTVKKNGFYWANPFYTKQKITQRARNLNGEKLKVNDMAGNPIEIAAVVVWQAPTRMTPSRMTPKRP
jgi:regulator of protease activity HflC (stomatin/prohibitin superfamily)